jgi:hypothetical protein
LQIKKHVKNKPTAGHGGTCLSSQLLRRLKQKDCKLEASLGTQQDPVSKAKQNKSTHIRNWQGGRQGEDN